MVDDEKILTILKTAKVIAVVGCSRDPTKDAHSVPAYLQAHGYRIIPVNPLADEILGKKCYHSVSDIKEKVDVVEIFRPSKNCLQVVREALKIRPAVIWMQLGIRNEEAARLAEENGITVVMDRCMKIEHMRLKK